MWRHGTCSRQRRASASTGDRGRPDRRFADRQDFRVPRSQRPSLLALLPEGLRALGCRTPRHGSVASPCRNGIVQANACLSCNSLTTFPRFPSKLCRSTEDGWSNSRKDRVFEVAPLELAAKSRERPAFLASTFPSAPAECSWQGKPSLPVARYRQLRQRSLVPGATRDWVRRFRTHSCIPTQQKRRESA